LFALSPRDRLGLQANGFHQDGQAQPDTWGRELFYGTPPQTHDAHCGTCGSFLYSVIAENGNTHVAMGSLIDTPSIRPSFHMFVGSKAAWYEITDGLPQFEAMPG
jgi:hypothetical protein